MEEETKKPIVLQSLTNPLAETFSWQYDSANYVLQAGERKDFPDYIAALGAKKIADKLAKTANKEERLVLQRAVLEEREPEIVAKEMGVNWTKVLEARKLAELKGKESARVVNLEAQVASLSEKLNKVLEAQNTPQEPKVETVEFKEEMTTATEGVEDLSWKELRKKAAELGIDNYLSMKKDELTKAVEDKINQ